MNKFIKLLIVLAVITVLYFALRLILKNEHIESHNDYTIIDYTDTCDEALESIYKDEDYTYYLTCIKSNNIYLKWEDGEIHKLMDELNNGSVTIDSLIEHGLEVYKVPNE